ncbi:MAG: hypothetical protein K940chlam8_00128 [Chlamydiae bacterium]|nr:hypothetical protein [Chlamydiota bacterium]
MRILIYCDEGVDAFSFRQTYKTLKKILKAHFVVVKSHTLLEYLDKADLFVMPGGRDVFYHRALQGKKTDALREFVENGGSYLGLCAGAYFGSKSIEFEKGHVHEVIEQRELAFFPGKAIGPALGLGKYEPTSCRGAECALIDTRMGSFGTYYNGGCYFEGSFSNAKPLAYFAKTGNVAIVECSVGKGKALLSGVHLEYSVKNLTEKQLAHADIEVLKRDEALRTDFTHYLLSI